MISCAGLDCRSDRLVYAACRLLNQGSGHQVADRDAEIAIAEPAATAPGRAQTKLRNRGTNCTVGARFVVETFP
jgi:hypothetical protein